MNGQDYSLQALNAFLDYLSAKHLLNKNTAQSRKAAANKVLAVLDEQEAQDLRQVDIDLTFQRFANKDGKSYKPDSLMVYRSRLKASLDDFFSYVENPAQFRPSVKIGGGSVKAARKEQKKDSARSENGGASSQEPTAITTLRHADHLSIPVPLRDGVVVKITGVPADLTENEAARLAAIIKAYAMI